MLTHGIDNLIIDVGMSEGNDTDFYLKKGFRVIGIEADPETFSKLKMRFSDEIKNEQLKLINRAAYSQSNTFLPFLISDQSQGHSRLVENKAPESCGKIVDVQTISWPDVLNLSGCPYYCKIDIKGAECSFLESMEGHQVIPQYISAECHKFAVIEALYKVGYRKFRLMQQATHNAFAPPNPAKEGRYLENYNFMHASGYFGKELYGAHWLDFQNIAVAFNTVERLASFEAIPHIWFDCHAWAPDYGMTRQSLKVQIRSNEKIVVGTTTFDNFERIESLGLNCEIGFALRKAGNDSGQLLRWAITPPDSLLKLLLKGPEHLFVSEQMIPVDQDMVKDEEFGIAFHSELRFRNEVGGWESAQSPDDVQEIKENDLFKFRYMASKFRSRITTPGTIFVYKAVEPVSDTWIFEVSNAMRIIARSFQPYLLIVEETDDPKLVGQLVQIREHVYRGYIISFIDNKFSKVSSYSEWIDLFKEAVSLMV